MMINPKTAYWLYILPHTYCNIKADEALIYNTKTGAYIDTTDHIFIKMLQEMHREENLGAILITTDSPSYQAVEGIVQEFLDKQMGRLVSLSDHPKKPIQLMPILNLQQEWERIKKLDSFDIGGHLNTYLWELDIHLNTTCQGNCPHCDSYALQLPCCRKTEQRQEMSVALLERIIEQTRRMPLLRINFFGGDVTQYSALDKLEHLFDYFQGELHLFNHLDNWNTHGVGDSFFRDVIVTFPTRQELFMPWLHATKTQFHFILTSEEDYMQASELISSLGLRHYTIHPFYTGHNEEFFRELVMQDKTEILTEEVISLRKIFSRQKMNHHFFGKFIILPDGQVHAALGRDAIGNVAEQSMIDLIQCEMEANTAWRTIRDGAPCSTCTLQYICPSPSTYEYAMKRNNLCLVK